jgi:hypothetical protein
MQPEPVAQASVYHSYLVRLWQANPDGVWRAMIQSVRTGETVRFADLESLFVFLQSQTIVHSSSQEKP